MAEAIDDEALPVVKKDSGQEADTVRFCAKLFRAGGSHIGIRWRFSPLQIALLPDNRRRLIAAACELYDLINSTPEGRELLQSTVIRSASTGTAASETSTEASSAAASSAHGDDVVDERPQRRLIAVEPPPSAWTRLCRFLSSLEWSWFPTK